MQITHEEARRLIHFNADRALDDQKKKTLSAHLKDCLECRSHAEEIRELEGLLTSVMKKHWHLSPTPLSLSALRVTGASKIQMNAILATRKVMIGVVFLALFFSAWQVALSDRQAYTHPPMGSLPAPAPSAHSTSTKIAAHNCAEVTYIVQENDTLTSIARHFSASKEEIMSSNGLKTESLAAGMKLTIPACTFTPTGTLKPTMFSTSYTPSLRPQTSTPGPNG